MKDCMRIECLSVFLDKDAGMSISSARYSELAKRQSTIKDIQTWLGHSNYFLTADTYAHSARFARLFEAPEMFLAGEERIIVLLMM